MGNRWLRGRRLIAAAAMGGSVLLASGCTWDGLNSLPLPGAVGTGSGSYELTVVVPTVGTLTQNSPVMIDDVTVGSIRKITADQNWQARVTIGLKEGTEVPVGTRAMVGQASLLGSQYLDLELPDGAGASSAKLLEDGDTIPLQDGGSYPSTEQTLSTLSLVLNDGGLAQVKDITTELNAALGGNEEQLRDLLPHLNHLISTLDDQRGDIISAMDGMNRLGGEVNAQSDVLAGALTAMDPATGILAEQKDALTDAIIALGDFSATANQVLTDSGGDLRSLVTDMEPVLGAVADAGESLPNTLTLLFTFPFPMDTLFNAMRGDYTNLWDEVDITGQRIQSSLLLGSPAVGWSDTGVDWVKRIAAAGDSGQADPFHPAMPQVGATDGNDGADGTGVADGANGAPASSAPGSAPGQVVEAPGAQQDRAGAQQDGAGARQDAVRDGSDHPDAQGSPPAAEPMPRFIAPDADLFGPAATGGPK